MRTNPILRGLMHPLLVVSSAEDSGRAAPRAAPEAALPAAVTPSAAASDGIAPLGASTADLLQHVGATAR